MALTRAVGDVARRDPMQELTDRIVAQLEIGVKPWVMPWDPAKCGGPQAPINGATGARYHGVNVLILGMDLRAFKSGDPRWCSYLQAQEHGWQVRKDERATTIFFSKQLAMDEESEGDGAQQGQPKTVRLLKHHAVFHFSQIDGVPPWTAPDIGTTPWRRPDAAEIIMQRSGATIRVGGERAFYSPSTDHIQLPPENAFRGPPEWAATALHELAHWTGHRSRLDRDMTKRFGSAGYAMEELRAELSSAFMASELGIPADIPQHASYIGNWLKPLKDDKREIFRAAADAQKITHMILRFHPDFAAQPGRPDAPAIEARHQEPFVV